MRYMKCKKRFISMAVSAALVITSIFVPGNYSRASESDIPKDMIPRNSIDEGTYGDAEYLYYKGNKNEESFLILEGKGTMQDIDRITSMEYNNYANHTLYMNQGWYGPSLAYSKSELPPYEEETNENAWNMSNGLYGSGLNVNEAIVGGEITNVGKYAFCTQEGYTRIQLGSSVTKISDQAFLYLPFVDIYIYGNVTEVAKDAFELAPATTTIHVISEDVASLIRSAGISGATVTADLAGKADDTPLRIALKKGTAKQNMHGKEEGFTAKSWKAFNDAMTDGENLLKSENKTNDEVDQQAKKIIDAMDGLVPIDELKKVIENVDKLSEANYTEDSWAALQSLVNDGKAKLTLAEDEDQTIEASVITKLVEDINNAIEGLVQLSADDSRAALAEVVATAEALIESDYSAKSWEALQNALTKADSVKDSEKPSEINAAAAELQKALDALVVEYPDEWFTLAGIPSSMEDWDNPIKVSILSGKVDEAMAGATKVEVTFDCAADTGYNPFTAINLGMNDDDWTEVKGSDASYAVGTKGWKASLELSAPLKAGSAYDLQAFTQNWVHAERYVFIIQAVKFLDADGKELKTVEAPKEVSEVVTKLLASAAEDAEEKLTALSATGDYTDESITAFRAYVESLKTKEDVDGLLPSEINEILTKLEVVTSELTPTDNTAARQTLTASIAQAKALDQNAYTEASWKKLSDAVAAAEKATASTVISEVNALNKAIQDAITGLVKATPDTSSDPNKTPDPNASSDPNKTPDPNTSSDPNASSDPNKTPDPNASSNPNPTKAPVPTKNPGTANQTKAPTSIGTPGAGNDAQTVADKTFVYKITKAATAKKAGTMTLTSLSAAGKKASKLSIPATTTINGKKYNVTKLGNNALKGAAAKSITLGKNIKAIPKGAFAGCKKLSTLTIKAKLKSVKKGAFKGCKKKIKVKGGNKKTRKANIKKLKKSGYKKFR